jgi:hypothetical protein
VGQPSKILIDETHLRRLAGEAVRRHVPVAVVLREAIELALSFATRRPPSAGDGPRRASGGAGMLPPGGGSRGRRPIWRR